MPILLLNSHASHTSLQIQQLLRQENLKLQQFRFLLPQTIGNFSYTPHKNSLALLKLPKVILPTYKLFSIHYLLEVGTAALAAPYFTLRPTYVVANNEKEARTAEELFNDGGLVAVLKRGQGMWCNRDPYGLWKHLSYMDSSSTEFLISHLSTDFWSLPPLSQSTGNTPSELEWMNKAARTFVKRTRISLHTEPFCIDDEGTANSALRWNIPTPAKEFAYDYVSFKLIPTLDNKLSLAKQFLDSLKTINHPLIFEIVSTGQTLYFQISCAFKDKEMLLRQLSIFFPKCAVIPNPSMQERLLGTSSNPSLWQVFSACPQNPIGSLKVGSESHIDPYTQLLSVMANVPSITQFIFSPLRQEALSTMAYSLERAKNLPSFRIIRKERLSEARAKQLQNAYSSDKYEYIEEKTIGGYEQVFYGISVSTDPVLEKKVQDFTIAMTKKQPCWLLVCRFLAKQEQALQKIQTTFLPYYETISQVWDKTAIKHAMFNYPYVKAWSIVSTDELSSLVHLPGTGVTADMLETGASSSSQAPESYSQQDPALNQGIILGENEFRGVKKLVILPHEVRTRHCYVLGKTRTGKSTLLFNSIRQDIELGSFGLKSAVCVIDPHGDLIEDILQYIPKERVMDTIYFDASERSYPISLNVISAKNEEEIGQLADDLLVTFKRISESWGERMENIIRHCFHTLLHAGQTTFLDIQNLLQSPPFRSEVLSRVKFQPLLDFWKHQFPLLPKDAAQPILSRMSKFSLSPILQGILNQKQSRLSFVDVIRNRKILLVNLSQGKIGEENTKLLGSIIVSQLQMAAMRQASLPKDQRIPIRLYIDEFQNFTTSAFEKILSEAGKYNLCMTVAHQYISQLNEETRNALVGNVGTTVVFQLGQQDASFLKYELGNFTLDDIVNLDSKKHEALCKPATQAKDTFRFTTFPPPPKPHNYISEIIENTKRNYSTYYTPAPSAHVSVPPSIPANPAVPPAPAPPVIPVTVVPISQPVQPVVIPVPMQAASRPLSTPIPSITPSSQTPPSQSSPLPKTPTTPANIPLTVNPPSVGKTSTQLSAPLVLPSPLLSNSVASASSVHKPTSNLSTQSSQAHHLRKQKIATAIPKSFASTQEKLLYYIEQAEYLSSNQIIRLCYGHMKEASRASTASRDLKLLVEAKKLKAINFGKQKLYFSCRTINPTNHNLILRDLFLKILNSNLEIGEINFFRSFKDFAPDLAVDFISVTVNLVRTLWEYDAGTESITELKKKVTRYYDYKDDYIIVFVFDTNERLAQVRKAITEPWLTHAVLTGFDSLLDAGFMMGIDCIGRPMFVM